MGPVVALTPSRTPTSRFSTTSRRITENGGRGSTFTRRSLASKERTRKRWSTCWRHYKVSHGARWSIRLTSWWRTPMVSRRRWNFWMRHFATMPGWKCRELWRSSSTPSAGSLTRLCWHMCQITAKPFEKWRSMAFRSPRTSLVGCFWGDLVWLQSRSSLSKVDAEIWKTTKWNKLCTTSWDRTTRPESSHWWAEKEDHIDGKGLDMAMWLRRTPTMMMSGTMWTTWTRMPTTRSWMVEATQRLIPTRIPMPMRSRRSTRLRTATTRMMEIHNWKKRMRHIWMPEGSLRTSKLLVATIL